MKRKAIYILTATLLCSCANRGIGPQGGPVDSTPPKVAKEVPLNGSTNYTGKTITVQFDEYIQLDNLMQQLMVCPPQQTPPEITAVGKTLKVEFKQEMQDSTTYTLDFGHAICDYHEKNKMPGYLFAFSTGDIIDSLIVRGQVINAENLNPVSGICVGLQRDLHDSAFSQLPLNRIGRTDSVGRFEIRNINSDSYRLYALNDISRDYRYQPGEALAWTPDTIQADTTGGDYLLWLFSEPKQRVYLQRAKREQAHLIRMTLSARPDSIPTVWGEDSTLIERNYLQYSAHHDTISLWLRDSSDIRLDTITLYVHYLKTDSLMRPVPTTDTLHVNYRAPMLNPKALEAKRKRDEARRVQISCNARQEVEVYDTIMIRSDYPLDSICADSIRLYLKDDRDAQNKKPVAYTLLPADSAHMAYYIWSQAWQDGAQYQLEIREDAARDIYGKGNKPVQFSWKRKTRTDYASLTIRMAHPDSCMRLQLLSDKDQVVRESGIEGDHVVWTNLLPTTYYVRMYLDLNGDGRWTTGDWAEKRQPEPVYYFPSKLTLKANWEFEETFDHTAKPQLESKPREIVRDENGKKK